MSAYRINRILTPKENRRPKGRRQVNETDVRLLEVDAVAGFGDLVEEEVEEFFAFFAVG